VEKVKGSFSEFWDGRAQVGVPVLLRGSLAGRFKLDAGKSGDSGVLFILGQGRNYSSLNP